MNQDRIMLEKVAELTDENYEWNIPLLKSLFEPEIVEEITTIHSPNEEFEEDKCMWRETNHGDFSISSAYRLLAGLNQSLNDEIWAKIWKLHTPEHVKSFVWLMKHESILTNIYLHGLTIRAPWFDLCITEIEDIVHVQRDCSVTKDVWRHLVAMKYW